MSRVFNPLTKAAADNRARSTQTQIDRYGLAEVRSMRTARIAAESEYMIARSEALGMIQAVAAFTGMSPSRVALASGYTPGQSYYIARMIRTGSAPLIGGTHRDVSHTRQDHLAAVERGRRSVSRVAPSRDAALTPEELAAYTDSLTALVRDHTQLVMTLARDLALYSVDYWVACRDTAGLGPANVARALGISKAAASRLRRRPRP